VAPKPVSWSLAAREDLLEALEYLVEESPQAAAALLGQIEAAACGLSTHSERGSRVREVTAPELRQILVGRYRLIYQVEPEAVGIVRLLHGSRDFRRAWRGR
jgi:plasmid stabilization system protein ParE